MQEQQRLSHSYTNYCTQATCCQPYIVHYYCSLGLAIVQYTCEGMLHMLGLRLRTFIVSSLPKCACTGTLIAAGCGHG
jgi:hypothetical protein